MGRCLICNETIETGDLPLSSATAIIKQHYLTYHPEALKHPEKAVMWSAKAYWQKNGRAKYYDNKNVSDMRKPATNPNP